jgi:hypothetical protein
MGESSPLRARDSLRAKESLRAREREEAREGDSDDSSKESSGVAPPKDDCEDGARKSREATVGECSPALGDPPPGDTPALGDPLPGDTPALGDPPQGDTPALGDPPPGDPPALGDPGERVGCWAFAPGRGEAGEVCRGGEGAASVA